MFELRATPKPTHKRRSAKRGNGAKFSEKTMREIYERDNYQCVRCGSPHLDIRPHHVIFRSQLGKGTKENGVAICRKCHELAHSDPNVRRWFERYQEEHLKGE